MVERLEQRVLLAATIKQPAWTEIGPGPLINNGAVQAFPLQDSAGAIEAIAAPVNNSDILFVASVNGGVWRSLNATAGTPSWTPMSKGLGGLSMGAIALAKFDRTGNKITSATAIPNGMTVEQYANTLILYAGNAQRSSFYELGAARDGLFKSTDGGRTWKQLDRKLRKLDIKSIVPHETEKDTILVGAYKEGGKSGVYRTTNGGTTFEQVLSKPVTHLVTDPGNPEVFYAGVMGKGVFVSKEGGRKGTWTQITNGFNVLRTDGIDDDRDGNAGVGVTPEEDESFAGADRVELAVHRDADSNQIFALLKSKSTNRIMAVFRSTTANLTGAAPTWTQIPGQVPDFAAQGRKHLAILADRSSPDIVYISGSTTPQVTGVIYKADVTKAVGSIWTPLMQAGADPDGGGPLKPTAPHPDSRDMVFNAAGDILQVDDGGIYRLRNYNTATPGWDSRNGNLRLKEFISLAYDPMSNVLVGGLQDNGAARQQRGGDRTVPWLPMTNGGDGGVTVVAKHPTFSYVYTSTQELGQFTRRKYDSNGVLLETVQPALTVAGTTRTLPGPGIEPNRRGDLKFDATMTFYPQYIVNAVRPDRLMFGTGRIYESFDNGATVVVVGGIDFSKFNDGVDDDKDGVLDKPASVDIDEVFPKETFGDVTALAYGGRKNGADAPDVAYIAGGVVIKVRSARVDNKLSDFTFTEYHRIKGVGQVRDIVLNPDDWTQGYVVDSRNRVYRFVNSGLSVNDWTPITGRGKTGLGYMADQLRSVECIVDPTAPEGVIVLVGGEGGVFATFNPSAGAGTQWVRVGRGLPGVIATDVRYDKTDDVLSVGTLGRGAWKIDGFLSKFVPPAAPLVASAAADASPAGVMPFAPWSLDPGYGPTPGADYSPPMPDPVALSAPPTLAPNNLAVLEITGDELADKNDIVRLAIDPGEHDVLNVFINNNTDEPDFSIETSAVERIVVTGGEGDDTLIIDHSNGLVSFVGGEIEFDEAGPGNDVRQVVGQTSIAADAINAIRNGLAAFADWTSRLAELADAAKQLPGIGASLAETFAIGDGSDPLTGPLRRGFADDVADYFNNDLTPTVEELVDRIKGTTQEIGNVVLKIDPTSVFGGIFTNEAGGQELRFDVDYEIEGNKEFTLDFSTEAESLGLTFDAEAKFNLLTRFDLAFSFGFDLTPGLSDAQAFFVRVDELSLDGQVRAGATTVKSPDGIIRDLFNEGRLDLGVRLGFLDAAIRGGSVQVDARVDMALNNPDDDPAGNVTLAELAGTSIGQLVDVTTSGRLNARLPILVSLPGLTSDARPVITISSEDLFGSVPEVKTENFDDLLDFKNITADGMLALLKQLATAIGQFGGTDVLAVPIPLTSKTLGEALDFAQVVSDVLANPLSDPTNPNAANFGGAQGLARKLAEVLGLDPSFINANYDIATKDLTYRVSLSDTFSTDANIDLGVDLGSLGGISTDSRFTFDGAAGADFVFGVNLAPLGADESILDRFFISDVKLTGSIGLSATDIDALAKIGFLGVGVQNGTGSLTASATIELQNPNPTAPIAAATAAAAALDPQRKLTLPELLANLLNDPAGLVVAPRAVSLTPGANVNVSNKTGNQNEPVIVIDPTNPQRLFMASNNERAGSMTAAYSTDGGATWTQRNIATGPESGGGDGFEFGCCDPAAAWDRFGNLYFGYLDNAHKIVSILISVDGGQTFSLLKQFTTDRLDRPVLATGPGDTPESASIWLAQTDVGVAIQVTGARVTGLGATNIGQFTTPRNVPGTGQGNFPDLAVGPKGQVIVTWQFAGLANLEGPGEIFVSTDPDGLNSAQGFGPAVSVATTNVGPKDAIPPQPDRKITADPHIRYAVAGPHIGRAYLLYTDESLSGGNETGDTNIFVRYSDKDGAAGSWSQPVRVNTRGELSSQFFPHLAVDPKTGNVAVAWYDARNDVQNKKVEFFASVSTDGGASFEPNVRVSLGQSDQALAPINPGADDKDFGDYTGLAFYDGVFYPAWADNASTTGNNLDIYVTKVTVGQLPAAPVTAAATAATDGIQFQGAAHAELPIVVSGLPLTLPSDARVVLDWPDLSDPSTLDVQFVNLDAALNFEGLDFDAILAALQQVVDYLSELKGFGFLNDEIPLVGVSVSDLFDYADEFAAKLEQLRANPVGTLQLLEAEIEEQFDLDPADLSLSIDGDNLKTVLNFVSNSPPISRNLNFDIQSLLASATGPVANLAGIVDISGSANLLVDIDTKLSLQLGIDLSDPTSPAPFLYKDSKFALDATIGAPDLDLTVAIGPLGAAITNGSAKVRHKNNPLQPAHFEVGLVDGDNDGKVLFSDLASLDSSDINLQLLAAVDVNLPISFPVGAPLAPPLVISIPDLAGLISGAPNSVNIVSAPDLAAALSNLDLPNDLSGIVDGLDQLLALLQTTLDNKAFNRNLPLVGTKLKDGAQVIHTFRTEVIARLKTIFQAADPKNIVFVQQALLGVLGDAPGGLDLLQDRNNDGKIDVDDIPVVVAPNDVRFDFRLRKEATTVSAPIDLDLGIPALQLQTTGTVDVEVGFDFNVGVGVNKATGVYFDTTAANELQVDLGVGINGFSGVGNLAFLQVDVKDDATNPSRFDGKFVVDLTDSDGKLRIGEFAAASLNARLDATADINLDLMVSFGGNANFPTLKADFNLDWAFNNQPTTDATFGAAPRIAFENVRMSLGSFADEFARPVLGKIKTILSPLQPLIDFLDYRLEPLEKIGAVRNFFDVNDDDKVYVREAIQKLDQSPVFGFLDGISALNRLVNAIPSGSSPFELNLGRFDLNNLPDVRNLTTLQGVNLTNVTPANIDAQLNAQAPGFNAALKDSKLGSTGSAGGKFELPLLQSPSQVFKLFLGQDVDLFRWDMPALDLNLEIHKTFPLLGPIGISFGGGVSVKADAGFGYDTFGLREWKRTGDESKVLEGFFLMDKPTGATNDPAEISATGKITVGAGFDVYIASANVSGSLLGTLELNLNNPDNDAAGKVRFSEVEENLAEGLLCVFDITGSLALQLSAHASVGVWPLEKSFDYDSPLITLLSFEHECKDDPTTQQDPILATDLGNGLLLLNMGPFAANRGPGFDQDVAEHFVVDPDPNVPGNVRVSAFGFSQSFAGITQVRGSGGLESDSIVIDERLNVTSLLAGGVGNDTLTGGSGSATLNGNEGNDALTGRGGNDAMGGGDGNDIMSGGGGSDSMHAGAGNDSVYGDDGNDTLAGAQDNDTLVGGIGNDSINGNEGNDSINGEGGDDVLSGDAGVDKVVGGEGNDTASGGDGADSVSGDGGNDSLDGGADNDQIYGGSDNDQITGGGGNDTGSGDAGNDTISGNAGDDSFAGGEGNDSINGNEGNDSLNGDAGNDTVLGGAGNDTITGGADADTLEGQADNDSIFGSGGNDSVTGGEGSDTLRGDGDNDLIFGHAGNDSIEGGEGDDSIEGGTGGDTARGQQGNDSVAGNEDGDSLFGDGGSDTVAGNAGDDEIHGGADADTLYGNADKDMMFGDAGDDSMVGGTENDTMFGNDDDDSIIGDDTVAGPAGDDSMDGGSGDDRMLGDNGVFGSVTLIGGDGADTQNGNDGNDSLWGQGGNDLQSGDAGDDDIEGNQGADSISGGDDDDDIVGGSSIAGVDDAADDIDGGDGHDVIAGDNAVITRTTLPDGLWRRYTAGTPAGTGFGLENGAPVRTVTLLDLDTIGSGDTVVCGLGDDTAFGQLGDDLISGDDGDDDLIGHLGADEIDGGAGDDGVVGDKGLLTPDLLDGSTARLVETNGNEIAVMINVAGTKKRMVTLFADARDGADVLTGGLGNDYVHGGGGGDNIHGDDPSVVATGGADALFGDNGNDVINAGAGDDHVYGGGGEDRLDGNTGADIVYGGGGQDSLFADIKDDKLIDWFGNFNDFNVPGPGFGSPTIIRSPGPHVRQFLSDLAAGDGSTDPEGELQIVFPGSPSNNGG